MPCFKKIILKIMTIFKKLIFRTKKLILDCLLEGNVTFVKMITLSTTSTSATWSPQTVTNSGAILTWDASGDITPTSQTINDPTFNLSANTGIVNMDVYDVSDVLYFDCYTNNLTAININQAIALTTISCYLNQITSLDVSQNTILTNIYAGFNQLTTLNVSNNIALKVLGCSYNLLTSLDVSNNPELITLDIYHNSIPSIDLSNNTKLKEVYVYQNNMTPSATDQIYIDLASGVGINGTLHIRNNRTSASDTARATLVSRGWTFVETYTT